MKRWFSLLVLGLSSCGLLPRSTPEPLRVLTQGPAISKELVVFLPGRWSTMAEFDEEGMFEIAKKRWPSARFVAADLHLGYYRKMLSARRLHEDIIGPARRAGVGTVRVVGVSMGGLGALIHDLEYPDDIDEMYLLSPFVGEPEVIEEIRGVGGLSKWKTEPQGVRDFSRRLWRGLDEAWKVKGSQPKVMLACGEEDRLADSNRLFAESFLSENDVVWQEGGHDWPTWRRLFEAMIE
jgi:pimeloyl-ACP methyl ester carboxylesterase